jgi:hypothetical protein
VTGAHLALLGIAAALGLTDAASGQPRTPGALHDAVLPALDGERFRPFDAEAGPARLVFFVASECPVSNRYAPEIIALCNEHRARGVSCLIVYAENTPLDALKDHARDYGLDRAGAVLVDRGGDVARTAGVSVTPEAAIVAGRGGLAYLGRIDNLYETLGRRRGVVTERDLRDALAAVLDGRQAPPPRAPAIGCALPFIRSAR